MIALLVRSFLRFIVRAPFSSLSVFLGVTLGVASVTGVHLLGSQVNRALESLQPPHLAAVTHVATHENLTVREFADLLNRRFSGQLPNLHRSLPLVEGRLPDGTRVVATDWLMGFDFEFSPPEQPATIDGANPVMVQGMPGVEVGQTLVLQGQRLQVVGLIEGSELTSKLATVYVDIGVGVDLLQRDPNRLDAVLLAVQDERRKLRDLLELLMPGLSAGLQLSTPQIGEGWRVHDVRAEVAGFGLARAVLFNVGALGSLSLLVAMLLIYQTCLIWLRRQREILARLQDIGVPRVALGIGFVAALSTLGVVAVIAGLFAGQAMASILLSQVGGEVGPQLDATVVAKGAIVGLGICVVGGVVAWLQEWRKPANLSTATWFVAGALVVFAWLILLLSEGLIGAFAAILLVAALICWLSLPTLKWAKGLTDRLRGSLLVRLSLREATWYAGDLAIAVSALALALGVSIGVALMVDSFRKEFVAMLDQRLQAELFVVASDDVRAEAAYLRADPEVRWVAAYGDLDLRVAGQPVGVGHTEFTAEEASRYGFARALEANEALVSERFLQALRVSVGESVSVGGRELRIVGAFPGFGDAELRMLLSNGTAEALAQGAGVELQFRRLSVASDASSRHREAILQRHPNWTVTDQSTTRDTAIQVFDRTFLITDALTALALIVATVALFNALGGLRLNQQATSELLEVIGLNRREKLVIDLSRAAAVGVVALTLAVPLGLWLGWVLCQEVNPRAFGWQIDLALGLDAFWVPLGAGALAVLVSGLLGVPGEHRGRLT